MTNPYSWILLLDDGKLLLKRHKNMIIFHGPIETTGMTSEDFPTLKHKVFNVITEELKERNNY